MSISRRRQTARRSTVAFAGAVAAALTFAGCSGVANQGQQPTASGQCATITVGVPLPFSGPYTDFGQTAYQGVELAVNEINDAGGITSLGGAKLKVAKGDTSSADTTQAGSATSKLISDGAVALIGAWSTVLTAAVAPVAEREGVPLITQAWGDPLSQNGYKFYFQPSPKASQMGAAGATYLLDAASAAGQKFTKVVAVAPNDAANQAQYTAAVKTFSEAGAEALPPVFYQAGITDVNPIVNTVASAHPDLILTGGSPADAILIVKGLRDAGITAPMLSFGGAFAGTSPSFPESLGEGVNGLTVVTAWNDDLPYDGVADAAKAYNAAYGTKYMPDHAGASWEATYLLAKAINDAASCEPAKIADALRKIDATSGQASAMPGGEVKFDADGTNPSAIPILLQWQNNVPVTIWPKDVASANFQSSQ